ncbi:MAG: bacteriophage holin [Haloechinothrix sp.]
MTTLASPALLSPYVLSVLLVIVGLIGLAFLSWRAHQSVRTTKAVLKAVGAVLGNERGLLRARSAALRVALAQRRSSHAAE